MSAGSDMDITCACGHSFKAWVWQSANITASPDLRKSVLDGTMNLVRCPACGARFHVEVPFLYHDMEQGEWIWVYPASSAADVAHIESEVTAMWERISATMPAKVRNAIMGSYKTMILFGMDALVGYLKSKQAQGTTGRNRIEKANS